VKELAQVTFTIQIVGDTREVSQAVKALGGELAQLSVDVEREASEGADSASMVAAMRAELTDGGRDAVRAMARLCLEKGGVATSTEVRAAMGGISPSALAGRLVSVTAFSGRHGFKPYTGRWTGREQEYRVEPELAQLMVDGL
jgi:hypothetical protein